MTPARFLIAWSLAASFAPASGAGFQDSARDERGPGAIEQALIEHACSAMASGVADTEAYQTCLSTQLASLRADFGRDLSRLSGSERRTLDSVCSRIRVRGRDAYVACLSAQLASLRNRRNRSNPAPSNGSAPPSPSATDPAPSVTARSAGASRVFSWSTGFWIGASLVTVCAVAAGILQAVKARRPPGKCRICGANVVDGGELCQNCRHEAAEALRRATAERADNLRAQEEELRRQREHDEDRRQQQAREEEEGLLRQPERVRREEQARLDERARHEEALRQRERAGQPTQFGAAAPDELDPYAVLGVSRGASVEQIRAGYEAARMKYDVEQVAHLSPEVQEHFKAKAQAVERAYQMLKA